MHEKSIAHRDLKPENLAFNEKDELVIIDLGSAKILDGKTNSTDICTLPYRAPELLLGNSVYSCAMDVWAVGCIIGEMLIGKLFFSDRNIPNKFEQLEIIVRALGEPPKQLVLNQTKKDNRNLAQAIWRSQCSVDEFIVGRLNGGCEKDSRNIKKKYPDMLGLLVSIFKYVERITAEEALKTNWLK